MTYRVLDISEWDIPLNEFATRGVVPPDPRFAFIVGAFDDEEVMSGGFLVCQMQFHAEPLVASNPFAIRGLVKEVENQLMKRVGVCNYFAFAADETIAGICEALGLRRTSYTTYHKTLYPAKLN